MQENYNSSIMSQNNPSQTPTLVQTDVGAKDGQNKCPKCGGTDIQINPNNGNLRCNFCRFEFASEKVSGFVENLTALEGEIIGSGTQDIVTDTKDIMTLKCSSCGSEVVIDSSLASQARCHWCRSTLSINHQVPNGSIPDVVLPFKLKKEDAKFEIEKFVGKRKFYAHPKFKQEFTTNNIMGVYFPYMVVDINAHSILSGNGEHTVRKYTRKKGDKYITYYDADLYNVKRDFDIIINGLTVESSKDKLNNSANDKTNNVINAIMPFDIENVVKWNANYLKGYTSEKRDTNISELKPLVNTQTKDIARIKANATITEYDRGVAWINEDLQIKGSQWKSAYLPVWLYSYQEVKGDKKILHYVAVNARTKETMGSVPIHMPKLILMSFLVELLGFLGIYVVDFEYDWTFLSVGVIYFIIIFTKYRNQNARHKYENETKTLLQNVIKEDIFIKHQKGLTNAKINGANNNSISNNLGNSIMTQFSNEIPMVNAIKDINEKGSDK